MKQLLFVVFSVLIITFCSSCNQNPNSLKINYARSENRESWRHHPVLGDPSFDTFEHNTENPVYTGVPGLEWPVNGFLFEDPVSKNWYIYVGNYSQGYGMGPDKIHQCTIFRSTNRGKNWEFLGPIFTKEPFYFNGDIIPVKNAPDVSVVYDNGRYHMAYDWASADADWKTIKDGKSGAGYAWSDSPEGPFHRTPEPLIRNGRQFNNPIYQKYDRFYASTLVRRQHDWLLLTIIDSGHYFAWGLVGSTAKNPEGPYSEPVPLFHVEGNTFQPPLMEYFPSFVHDGWIYAPSTSVANNRNYQMMQRVPIEQAMDPKAWELWQAGSVWHALPVPNEYHGIWGQTLTGFVDENNTFQVMFPSRTKDNLGTINIASRPWEQPYNKQGFTLSSHEGPSLTLIKKEYQDFRLETSFTLTGSATFFWAHTAPLGPNKPQSGANVHPISMTRYNGFSLSDSSWQVISVDEFGNAHQIASGLIDKRTKHQLDIDQKDDLLKITLDNTLLWQNSMKSQSGKIGLLLDKHSNLKVNSFEVTGKAKPGVTTLLYTEGLLGAGQSMHDWENDESPYFRYDIGAISKAENQGRIKWNYHGSGFTLWSPKGPKFGSAEVFFDGVKKGTVDLYAPSGTTSAPVFTLKDVPVGYHAIVVESKSGRLVVDCVDVMD